MFATGLMKLKYLKPKTQLYTIAEALNSSLEGWAKVVNTNGSPINRKLTDPDKKRSLEVEDLPTFLAARMERILSFLETFSRCPILMTKTIS